MATNGPLSGSAAIEQEITGRIQAAGPRLRFDKVVLRLVAHLKAALSPVVPHGQAVILTVTAPIRLPAKTAAALEALVRSGRVGSGTHDVIHGNQVRARLVTGIPAGLPNVLAFVHNPESDAGLILDLAESRLLGRDPT